MLSVPLPLSLPLPLPLTKYVPHSFELLSSYANVR